MSSKTKIILVDDHALFREGMKLLIENEGIGEVIAEAENGMVFLELLKGLEPDLVLMDIDMPVMDGFIASAKAKEMMPGIKILALTMFTEKDNYTSMINAGANGYILKTSGKKEFEKAITTILSGENYFSNEILRQIIYNFGNKKATPTDKAGSDLRLTEREHEVMYYLCKGYTSSEIADTLCRSIKTIEAHRSTLLEKTNTRNTINLVLFAIKNHLVDINF